MAFQGQQTQVFSHDLTLLFIRSNGLHIEVVAFIVNFQRSLLRSRSKGHFRLGPLEPPHLYRIVFMTQVDVVV